MKLLVCEGDPDQRFGHTTFMVIRRGGRGPKLGCACCWFWFKDHPTYRGTLPRVRRLTPEQAARAG